MEPTFSEQMVRAAAASNSQGEWFLSDIAEDQGHPLHAEVSRLEESWTVGRSLDRRVALQRLLALKAGSGNTPVRPYDHTDLATVACDKNGLVDLSGFDRRIGGFRKGSSIFEILPSTDQKHSCYWVCLTLEGLATNASIRIRLDPFMVHPVTGYRTPFFTMQVWGGQLTWAEVLSLKQERTWRWVPDGEGDTLCTEAVWTPRDDEVHLQCEEVPRPEAASFRAARYFHTIVSRSQEAVIHCDGAVRIMTPSEASRRTRVHVRDAGKVGTRVKVFQVDGTIEPSDWSALMAAFFVWNDDAQDFARKMALGEP